MNKQEKEAKVLGPCRACHSPPCRAEPCLHRAGLAGAQALHECGCRVREGHGSLRTATPPLLGLLPAQEGACTWKRERKYISDKTL